MYLDTKKKRLIIVAVVSVLVILFCIVGYFLTDNEEMPIVENEDNNIPAIEEVIIDDIEDIPEVEQDVVLGQMSGVVISVGDLSTRYEYRVIVGSGTNETESSLIADINTVYYDFSSDMVTTADKVTIGSKIVFYATGSYNKENMTASLICIGDDTGYSYSVVTNREAYRDGYLLSLENTVDKIYLTTDCIMMNGLTKGEIYNTELILPGDKLLYKYDPNFEITDSGNIYTVTELVQLGNTSTDN